MQNDCTISARKELARQHGLSEHTENMKNENNPESWESPGRAALLCRSDQCRFATGSDNSLWNI